MSYALSKGKQLGALFTRIRTHPGLLGVEIFENLFTNDSAVSALGANPCGELASLDRLQKIILGFISELMSLIASEASKEPAILIGVSLQAKEQGSLQLALNKACHSQVYQMPALQFILLFSQLDTLER